MSYNKKKYSFFAKNYEQGNDKYTPKYSYTFYFAALSTLQCSVSHYYGDVILHFSKSSGVNKQQRYLPMRESEYRGLLNMAKEIENR